MSRTRAEIVGAVPQLAPLSNPELTEYLAAFRAAHARANRLSGFFLSLVGACLGVGFFIVFVLLAMSIFRAILAVSVLAGSIFLAVALIGVPWFLIRLFIRETARSRVGSFDRELLVRVLQSPPLCIRCGYGLAGVGLADNRPGVVRCPECAMVCPVDDLRSSSEEPPRSQADQGSSPLAPSPATP